MTTATPNVLDIANAAATNFAGEATKTRKNSRNFSVHWSKIRIDPDYDKRDRNDPDYIDHAEVIYNGIVKRGGIEETIEAYKVNDPELGDLYYLIDGRTRYTMAVQAIVAGELSEDLEIGLETVPKGNPLVYLAKQYRRSNSRPFNKLETAELVADMMRRSNQNLTAVANELGMSEAEANQYDSVSYLMPDVKALIKNGTVKPTVALELAEKFEGDELLKKCEQVDRIMKTKKDDPNAAKGKGAAPNRVTKGDVYRDDFMQLSEVERYNKRTEMVETVEAVINIGDLDIFTLDKIYKLAAKAMKAAEKGDKKRSKDEIVAESKADKATAELAEDEEE